MPVNVTQLTTGVPIAAETVGTTVFQQVKLVDGGAGSTTPIIATSGVPAAGSMGLVVAVKPGVSVSAAVSGTVTVATIEQTVNVAIVAGAGGGGSVTTAPPSVSATGQAMWIVGGQGTTANPVVVTGTVSAGAGTTVVSGTLTVNGSVSISGTGIVSVVPGVSVTIQQGASVSAVVSGTVTALLPGSTTGSSGMSGVLVWLGASQTILVSTQISGTVTVSNGASVTIQQGASVSAVVSGTVTIANGASVSAVVSGTVTALLPGSTTGSSGMSGVLVWLGASQSVLISTQVSGTVTVNGTVTITPTTLTVNTAATVAGASVTIQQGASVSAVVSGTVTPILASTTAGPSISHTGLVVWIAGGQGTTATPIVVTGTVAAGAGTTVVSGTLTVVAIDRTTATPSAAGTGAIVWVANPGAAVATTVLTVQTILGTAVVSVVPGLSVSAVVSGTVTVSGAVMTTTQAQATGLLVWLAPTQTLSVNVGASTAIATTTQAAVTGAVVWLAPTQTANVTVVTQLGTQIVSVVPGLSVSAVVSGTVSVLNVVPVTTAASVSVTGIPVWLNPTQQVVVSGLAGQSVSAVVSGTVTVNGSVSLSGTGIVSVVPGVSINLGSLATVVATTTASSGQTGLIVWVGNPGNGTTVVSGTVSVVNGVSVSAVVSGTVSVLNVVPVTTAASVSVTGIPVWMNPTQQVVVGGTAVVTLATGGTLATLLGTVAVNVVAGGAAPGSTAATQSNISGQVIWLAPTQTLASVAAVNTVVTVLGTQIVSVVPGLSVTVQQGASVSAVVSGTVTVANGASVTIQQGASISFPAVSGVVASSVPATSNAFGMPVWIVGGQTATGAPVMVTVGSTALVSVVPGASVSIINVLNTIVTQLGTQVVSVVPGVSVTIQQGASVSAVVSGTVTVSGAVMTTTQADATGILVWLAPTQTLSVAIGASTAVATTTQAAVTGAVVWLAPTQTVAALNTVVTVLGTQIVSVVPGLSVSAVVSGTVSVLNVVPVTTQASVSVTGIPVWWNPTAAVAISGGALAGAVVTGTQLATSGQIIWLAPTQTASVAVIGTAVVTLATGGTVAVLDVGRTNVIFVVTSTTVGISGSTMPFSCYIGMSTPVAGTTSIVVPAGKTFRVLSLELIAQNSVATSPALVRLLVLASTALPTWSTTTPVMAQVAAQPASATVPYSVCGVQVADIPAGATIGVAFSIGTSGASIVQALVKGYYFP